jgi:hypothetical protein
MKYGGYSDASQAEAGLHVVAGQIAKDYGVKVKFHNGTAVDADIFKKIIRVPSLACCNEVPETGLMLVRARTYHEAGHCGKTIVKKEDYMKVKGSLFKCWNAIEDRRMEREVGKDYVGCEIAFREKMDYYNDRIAHQISVEGINAPLWEALCAMGFKSLGVNPAWTLTEKAKLYYDAGRDIFMKWHDCKDAYDALELAKELHEALKESAKDYEEEKDPEEGQGQGSSQGGGGQEGEEDEDAPSHGSGSGDLDDEEDEGSQDSQGGDQESEEDENSQDSHDGNGQDGEEENDSEESKESKGKDGDEESDDASEEEDSQKSKGGEEEDSKDWNAVLDEDYEGGLEEDELLDKVISQIFDEIEITDETYLSYREDDYVVVPDRGAEDQKEYKEAHSKIAGEVVNLTYGLEQSLRTLSRSRRKPYLRQGKLDKKRMVHIAKGTSKEVFYKKQDGITLDTAVFIIIDESGSMSPDEPRKAVMAISEAMNGIGVPFAVCGSTANKGSRGISLLPGFARTAPIEYRYYKNFSESWISVGHRIMNIGSFMNNIDGEVIEFGAFALSSRPEKRKFIISINDGMPCSGQGRSDLLASNIVRVCKNVRESGTEVYGFGIDTDRPAQYYGKENFIHLDSEEGMGPEFVRGFANILTGGLVSV